MAETRTFDVTVDGEKLTYKVRKPSGKVLNEAADYKAVVFKRELSRKDADGKNTAIFRTQAYNIMKEKGLWSDEDDKSFNEVNKQIDEKIKLLSRGKSGNIKTTKDLRKVIVEDVRVLRAKQFVLIERMQSLDNLTIESIAEQAELDYLVYKSTYNDGDDPLYSSLDDYLEKKSEDYSIKARQEVRIIIGESEPDWYQKLPENELLKKYKFLDDKGRDVIDGKLVNFEGKPVNEKGELVDESGNKIEDKVEYEKFDDE